MHGRVNVMFANGGKCKSFGDPNESAHPPVNWTLHAACIQTRTRLRERDPRWGWGWIGWSDCYRFTRTERVDLNRCEQILREGFAIADVRDSADIADRLADVCDEQGHDEEGKEFRRQSERRATAVEVSRTVSSTAKVLRTKTQVNFGGAGLPLSELSNVAGMLREMPTTPVTRQKIGRNEPCPCGSGKKYKKCCGA
jgi:uncharacterized protein YchJ